MSILAALAASTFMFAMIQSSTPGPMQVAPVSTRVDRAVRPTLRTHGHALPGDKGSGMSHSNSPRFVLMCFEREDGSMTGGDPIWLGERELPKWLGQKELGDAIAGHLRKSIPSPPETEVLFHSVGADIWSPRERRGIRAALDAILAGDEPEPVGPFFHNLQIPYPRDREPTTYEDNRSWLLDILTERAEHLEEYFTGSNPITTFALNSSQQADFCQRMADKQNEENSYRVLTLRPEQELADSLFANAVHFAKNHSPDSVNAIVSIRDRLTGLIGHLRSGWHREFEDVIAEIYEDAQSLKATAADIGALISPQSPAASEPDITDYVRLSVVKNATKHATTTKVKNYLVALGVDVQMFDVYRAKISDLKRLLPMKHRKTLVEQMKTADLSS